jgi:hypothetical protein
MEKGGLLTAKWTVDFKDELTDQPLGTATYISGAIPFNFISSSVEFDDVAVADVVESASIKVTLPMKTDRHGIQASATKKEPIVNGLIGIEATIGMEFSSLAQHAAYTNATRRKFELISTHGDAGGGNPFKCAFTLPSTVTTGEGPVVEGPDVLTQELTLEGVDNGSAAPLTIEYVSTDTAL